MDVKTIIAIAAVGAWLLTKAVGGRLSDLPALLPAQPSTTGLDAADVTEDDVTEEEDAPLYPPHLAESYF